jgi:hypothetical protein
MSWCEHRRSRPHRCNSRIASDPRLPWLDEGFENTRVPHTSIHRIEADGSWPTGCAGGSLATWLPDLFVPVPRLDPATRRPVPGDCSVGVKLPLPAGHSGMPKTK